MREGPVLLCGSCRFGPLKPVLDLGEQPLPQRDTGKRFPLRLVQCPQCTLVQLDYIVPQQELFPADYPYTTGNTRALREHFAQQALFIASMVSDGELIIDIGGNDGTMLKALREIAPENRLLLIEPTNQAKRCDQEGIGVQQEFFTAALAGQIRHSYGQATVITASNVFAHIPDPHDFLDGMTELLTDDGALIIDNQDWAGVVNGLQIDTIYHEHLRYYSPASLSYLLSRHGLLVTSLTPIAMHGGAFRAVVRRQKPDLQGRADQLAERIARLVAGAAEAGPVYGVAASTRATSLVNYAGLGIYLHCVCEITGSEKIGGTIPGTVVPIVNEAALIEDQPPHALLLAWDLAGSIVPKLRQRGYRGKFIIPLPEPRISDA